VWGWKKTRLRRGKKEKKKKTPQISTTNNTNQVVIKSSKSRRLVGEPNGEGRKEGRKEERKKEREKIIIIWVHVAQTPGDDIFGFTGIGPPQQQWQPKKGK
jgi:hypothetical protein